jgi:hypothetical protein
VLSQIPNFLDRDSSCNAVEVRRNMTFEAELQSCARSSELYSRNYYAWSHRQWLTDHLDHEELSLEICRSRLWSDLHVSDHSALSHRQSMLRRLQELPGAGMDVVLQEFGREQDHIQLMLERYPGHESLWCHARFVWLYRTRLASTRTSWQVLAEEAIGLAQRSVEDDGVSLFERQRRYVQYPFPFSLIPIVSVIGQVCSFLSVLGASTRKEEWCPPIVGSCYWNANLPADALVGTESCQFLEGAIAAIL